MFGLGAMEIVVILGLALIVLGPQKLPELAKQLAKLMGDLRQVADDLRNNFEEASREVDVSAPPPKLNFPNAQADGTPLPGGLHEQELPPGVAKLAAVLRGDTTGGSVAASPEVQAAALGHGTASATKGGVAEGGSAAAAPEVGIAVASEANSPLAASETHDATKATVTSADALGALPGTQAQTQRPVPKPPGGSHE